MVYLSLSAHFTANLDWNYLSQTRAWGAFPWRFKARYRYLIQSATDQARTKIRNAWDAAVLAGKLYQIIQTWITRVKTCMEVVLTGDLMRPLLISIEPPNV